MGQLETREPDFESEAELITASTARASHIFHNTMPRFDIPQSTRIASGFMYLEPSSTPEATHAKDDERTAASLSSIQSKVHTPA